MFSPTVYSLAGVVGDDLEDVAKELEIPSRACRDLSSFWSQATSPGCVWANLDDPLLGGANLLEEIVARQLPLVPVMWTDQPDVRRAVQAMRGGAFSVLPMPVARDELLEVIREALSRATMLARLLADRAAFVAAQRTWNDMDRRVVSEMLEGKTNAAIARRMEVSMRTIESRRQKVFASINTRTVAPFARWYGYATLLDGVAKPQWLPKPLPTNSVQQERIDPLSAA